MILNPVDVKGDPVMYPDAPAPVDPATLCEQWMVTLVLIAANDVGYARWRAGTMGQECPEWYGELLPRLDDYLTSKGITKPPKFVEPASNLPPMTKGRRGLPKARFFHDKL